MICFKKVWGVTALLGMGVAGMVQAEDLRFVHIVPPSHVWHQVAERFSENLRQQSSGRLAAHITPQVKAWREPQLINLLRAGSIHFSILTAGALGTRSESMLGWFLPYTFADVAQAGAAARTPAAREMLQELDKQGLIGLGYAFAGMRHVLSVEPVQSPADLQGRKIRSFPNRIFRDWWQANGATPTDLPLSEVAPALSAKLLYALDVDLDAVVGLKLYRHAGHLTLTNHMAFPGIMVVSAKWWKRQSAEDQALIRRTYAEAEAWGLQRQIAAEASNLRVLKDAGVAISEVDLQAFRQAGQGISASYAAGNPQIRAFAEQAAQVD